MVTELYIESYRLDITKEISALLTFSLDDIKNFSDRSTTWSKTIVLPGTSANNKIFGHIFQIGISNNYDPTLENVTSNFNPSVSANCVLFQDQLQTFSGTLRLLQINYTNGLNGRVEYEVSIFGNLSKLNSILSGRLLEQLDFSAYDHVYNTTNIVQSWDNPGGSGYYYPLIDYGTYSVGKHDWDIHTFRPGFYAKEYADKIFENANFRYYAPLLDGASFKKLVIPHSQKYLTSNISNLIKCDIVTQQTILDSVGVISYVIPWDTYTGTGFVPVDSGQYVFRFNGAVTSTIPISFDIFGLQGNGIEFFIKKNGPLGDTLYHATAITEAYRFTGTINASFALNDTIEFELRTNIQGFTVDAGSTWSSTTNSSIPVIINVGATVRANAAIPKNIRQIDFLLALVKLYNLYVYEDKNDPFLIRMTPFIDFYSKNFSNAEDWTQKLDRKKVIKSKPMSELNAKIYKFRYKGDSDYYNDLYKKRYNEGYGDRVYDSEFEFTQQVNEFEIVFSATPLVGYVGEDKIYSTIFKRTGSDTNPTEENTDSNIRLLHTKKISGVSSWSIKDVATVLSSQTSYGYAGHFDDPVTPTTDLNFGATKELFYVLNGGSLSNNQFNVYWSSYMADITHKDSKLISAYFKLDTKDILNLDFSKYIYVDGITFKLNQIRDYNATKPGVCLVELLKVNSAAYTEAEPPNSGPDGCFLLWSNDNILDWDDSDQLVYSDCQDNPGDGEGEEPDPSQQTLSWTWSKSGGGVAWVGFMTIKLNGTVVANAFGASTSGSFFIGPGDSVVVTVAGSPQRQKVITISNDVDGQIFSGSTGSSPFNHSFLVEVGKNYTVTTALV